MSVIEEDFEMLGGTVTVEIVDHRYQRVSFSKNGAITTISEASGELYDWDKVYRGQQGASLASAERKAAKNIAIEAIGDFITALNDE